MNSSNPNKLVTHVPYMGLRKLRITTFGQKYLYVGVEGPIGNFVEKDN